MVAGFGKLPLFVEVWMTQGRCLAVLCALSAAVGACGKTSSPEEPQAPSTSAGAGTGGGVQSAAGNSGTGASGTVAGAGGTASAGAPSGGMPSSPPIAGGSTCTPGVAVSTQFPRLLNRQYDAVMRDLLGVTTLSTTGKRPSESLYPDYDGDLNTDAWRHYLEVAEVIGKDVFEGSNRSKFIDCDPAADGCLTETIRSFGRRAFRRPLTDDEIARFEKLADTDPPGTPEEVAQTTLVAFLVSPSFLQLTEVGSEREGEYLRLTSHEVAARLSFLLWDSIPDAPLDEAADNGELETKEQIFAQAERLLAQRDKAGPAVVAAHRAYLGMDLEFQHWWSRDHDPTLFPLFNEATKSALRAELELFFEEVVYRDGSFEDLFVSNLGFVNRDTAWIYELDPASYGSALELVELDPDRRPGLLTRGGFLSSFSRYATTSPTQRGTFISFNLLGLNTGPPSPDELSTPGPAGEFATERAYYEAMTSAAVCSGCHEVYLDPPGFVLEAYDSVGRWQTIDPRGGRIDTTATVQLGPNVSEVIESPRELMERIGTAQNAVRRYVEELVAFATRRAPNANDACDVDRLAANLSKDGHTLLDLFADLTQTDSFRLRAQAD